MYPLKQAFKQTLPDTLHIYIPYTLYIYISHSSSLTAFTLLHSLFQCCSLDPCPLWPVVICQKGCIKIAVHFQNGVKAALSAPQAFFSSNTLHLPQPDCHIFSPPLTSYALPPRLSLVALSTRRNTQHIGRHANTFETKKFVSRMF